MAKKRKYKKEKESALTLAREVKKAKMAETKGNEAMTVTRENVERDERGDPELNDGESVAPLSEKIVGMGEGFQEFLNVSSLEEVEFEECSEKREKKEKVEREKMRIEKKSEMKEISDEKDKLERLNEKKTSDLNLSLEKDKMIYAEMKRLRNERDVWKKSFETEREVLTLFKEKVGVLRKDNFNLSEEISKKDTEISCLKKESRKFNKNFDLKKEKMKEKVVEKKSDITSLNSEISRLEKENLKLKEENTSLEIEKEQLTVDILSTRQRKDFYRKKLNKVVRRKENLEKNLRKKASDRLKLVLGDNDNDSEKVQKVQKVQKVYKPYNEVTGRKTKKQRLKFIWEKIVVLCGGTDVMKFLKDLLQYAQQFSKDFSMPLTVDQAFMLKTKCGLSVNSYDNIAKLLYRFTGLRIFPSRKMVTKLEQQCMKEDLYKFSTKQKSVGNTVETVVSCQCTNVPLVLGTKVTDMAKKGELIFDKSTGGELWFSVCGDKGGDITKVTGIVGNTNNANSVHHQIMLGFYDGNDTAKDLLENLPLVVEQLNNLTEVEYEIDGKIQKIKVRQHLVGDHKFICEMLGHEGQSSQYFCPICTTENHNRGKKKNTLKNWNHKDVKAMRTLETYMIDSEKGKFGVIKGSIVVFKRIKIIFIIPPFLHLMMGIVQKYIVDYVTSKVNAMDNNTSYDVGKVNEKKKIMKDIEKDIATRKAIIKEGELDIKILKSVCVSYSNIINKKISPADEPEDECACNSGCLYRDKAVYGSDDEIITWQKCVHCDAHFHRLCIGIIDSESREKFGKNGYWACHTCCSSASTLEKRLEMARKTLQSVEVQTNLNKQTLEVKKNDQTEVTKLLNSVIGENRTELETAWKKIGADRSAWFQEFTGNHIKKILSPEGVEATFSVFKKMDPVTKTDHMTKELESLESFMTCMRKIMSYGKASVLDDADIIDLENLVDEMAEHIKSVSPEETVTQKLHVETAHLVPFAKLIRSLGRTNEQGIESLHAFFKRGLIRYACIRDKETRYKFVLRYMLCYNRIYDTWIG